MQSVSTPLRVAGVMTIVISLVLGIVVTPIAFIGVAVGAIDLVLAMAMARGWIGQSAAGADPVAQVEVDPSYNPYARED